VQKLALRWHAIGTKPEGVHVYTCAMSQRMHVILTDRQHAFLAGEAIRTGLPMGELVRRAIDGVYRPEHRPKVNGFDVSIGVWRRPDAAIVGRRRGPWRLTD
jgi:hypothetical protein